MLARIPVPKKWKYWAMVFVINTVGRMPLRWRYGVARFIADRVYAWNPTIRENLLSNARHVLGADAPPGEIERVAKACARNTGRYYADIVGMHRMDVQAFYENDLVLEGIDYVTEAQRSGHGVVIASAHYANPEFAVQGLAVAGVNVFALVEQLDPPELGRLMRGLRSVHGHRYEPVGYGGIKNAIAWLRNQGVVAILIDRDIQKHGVEFCFCGYPARFPTGAVDLALRTDAVLMPAWVRREGGYKVHTWIGPPMELVRTGDRERDLRVNTQRLLTLFEHHLKRDPGQWSVLDRIWPEQVPPRPAEELPPVPEDQPVQ